MKNMINKKYAKLVVITILLIFLTTSANSAMIKNNTNNGEFSYSPVVPLSQNYYEWTDNFNNEQLIDSGQSYNYMVAGGVAKMIDTFPIWTDPEWERMKPIELDSNGNYDDLAIFIEVSYDSDMKSDFGDIRFKHEDYPSNYLNYWMEDYAPSNWAKFWVLVPEINQGSSMMYMFYKNPSANYDGNFGDVFTDWEEEWANDKEITTLKAAQEGCWDPDVEYGNGEFLVCWEEGMPRWLPWLPGFKQEIMGSIYDPDGDILVSEKIVFQDSGVDYWRNENPSIAYGSGKWFVSWEHYEPVAHPPTSSMDIYARTVQRSGSSFQLGNLIEVCTAQECQADSNAEYDSVNNRFMVVWEDARDGVTDYDIRGSVYSSSGSVIVNNKLLCNDANSQCEPWAAYDPINEQYMIVWEDGVAPANGPFRIRGGIFDENLNTIDIFTVAEPSGYPNENLDYNFPCVEFDEDSERYLVTWNEADISDDVYRGDVLGKIFDTSGEEVVDTFTVRTGSFERSDIVPYLSEAFLVAYDNQENVYGRLVTSEGNLLGGDIQLSASPSAEGDWTNMATDGSEIFVAWEDIRITYYPERYDFFPDVFGNIWNLNIPSGGEVTYSMGEEKQFISEAQVTSIKIDPDNLEKWHQFLEEHTDSITFDIYDETGENPILEDISSGQDLSIIDPVEYDAIKLRAHFTRSDPTYTPTLDSWTVLYEGLDLEPPVTTVESIDGDFAPNHDWYKSEIVTVWLKAVDYPEDTGSGIDKTYYTLNGGEELMYNEESGIDIFASEPDFWTIVEVNFWSVDNEGNIEDRTKTQNYRTIRIDGRPPYVEITSPANEEKVNTPFLVTADATDNYEVDYVEFDLEPFGKRPGLPWRDTSPPWEWLCDEEPLSRPRANANDPQPRGVNKMVRAQVYDVTGQTWIHEVWVYIENWGNSNSYIITINNFRSLLGSIKLGMVIDDTLDIDISPNSYADSVKFEAKRIITRGESVIWDDDFSDGCSASFDIPTGFYKITTYAYKEGEEIASNLVSRVFFINR